MATEEDLEKAESADEPEDEAEGEPEAQAAGAVGAKPRSEAPAADADAEAKESKEPESEKDTHDDVPVQLGYQRYVYAAYMAGAMLVAFLVAKIGHTVWYRLGQWKPELGEPKDEVVYVAASVIGILITLYYWRKPDARQYTDEVAEELSKVTWPSRKEVTNSTTVVVLTTVFATVFFALMDRFWGFVTDKIYTF